jgi:replicative DNA helicase|uniref:Replicative DNA helicase n=1 Tax=Asterionella formosa TaxID=210441 RepID=A0A023H9P3_9STRA|nr:replication helicase subunit [Asterionella formosa]AGH28156.1 replication helicase subunit [Asterionella formosa]WGN98865.1 replication helicase subunit [Asterionella formosa]
MNKFQNLNESVLIQNYLPHNFLAEKIVLSCLLLSSEAIEITFRTISIDTFYFKNHQEIYKAILILYENKRPIDIITITTFLQDNGLLKKIGGVKVLIELINQVPNLIHLEEYLKLIKDKFLRRSLIKLGYKAINSGYITNFLLEDILNDFETELFNLTNEFKPPKLSTSADLIYSVFLELKQKANNPQLPGLSSGFYGLDSLTQGFQKSDLIIIAGRPSIGKTAFCLSLGINVIKYSKIPILLFSLEMSKEQIIYRLLGMETNINQMRLRSGKLYRTDWVKLSKVIKILSKLPFFIDDTPDLSVQDIRSKIKTILFEQNKVGLIMIDYLQLMQNSKFKSENRAYELSQITRSLKIIAREFNVPIIALSQLSRNVENRIDKKPILSDLRESGSIEQDADLVLMLHKSNKTNLDENILLTDLIIAKQRNGPTGTIQILFDKKRTKYINPDFS